MITPHPQRLRTLLARYAQARIAHFENEGEATRRALEDATYTLCVTTGTSTAEAALHRADDLLAGSAAPYRSSVRDQGERAMAA
ncbi:DUF5133 domain-containing protein [Streptomyces albidoflavus]|uniref:DUF5133 domain-containing protein n=1 Tax=Streptomyces albidoflavus TaxID=1886 RepID=UPI00332A03A1